MVTLALSRPVSELADEKRKLMKKGVRNDLRFYWFSHRSVNRSNNLTQDEVSGIAASSVCEFVRKPPGEASTLKDRPLYGLTWSPSPMAALRLHDVRSECEDYAVEV